MGDRNIGCASDRASVLVPLIGTSHKVVHQRDRGIFTTRAHLRFTNNFRIQLRINLNALDHDSLTSRHLGNNDINFKDIICNRSLRIGVIRRIRDSSFQTCTSLSRQCGGLGTIDLRVIRTNLYLRLIAGIQVRILIGTTCLQIGGSQRVTILHLHPIATIVLQSRHGERDSHTATRQTSSTCREYNTPIVTIRGFAFPHAIIIHSQRIQPDRVRSDSVRHGVQECRGRLCRFRVFRIGETSTNSPRRAHNTTSIPIHHIQGVPIIVISPGHGEIGFSHQWQIRTTTRLRKGYIYTEQARHT